MNHRVKSCFTELESLIRKNYQKKKISGELGNELDRAVHQLSIVVARELASYEELVAKRGPAPNLGFRRLAFQNILRRSYEADPVATAYELAQAGERDLESIIAAEVEADLFRKTG